MPQLIAGLPRELQRPIQLRLYERDLALLHPDLGVAGEHQREEGRLPDDLGMAECLVGRVLRIRPALHLTKDDAEVVKRLRGAAPIPQALIGDQRRAIETQCVGAAASKVSKRSEIVGCTRGELAVGELMGQSEGAPQPRLGVLQPSLLDADHAEEIEGPHAAVPVAAGPEPDCRILAQGASQSQIAEPGAAVAASSRPSGRRAASPDSRNA